MSEFLSRLREKIAAEEKREAAPRGVSPKILLSQVENTVPFIFTENLQAPYLDVLRAVKPLVEEEGFFLAHRKYFELCVSAHHATVASYVPTDVDNQIRFRLWHPSLEIETLEEMADDVLASESWDATPISRRQITSEQFGVLSGHNGEWFSTAVAAYGALRRQRPRKAKEILDKILAEVKREAEIFTECQSKRDGVALLKAATIISHNLGDLDRVVEMWNLGEENELVVNAFKAGHKDYGDWRSPLYLAGVLNKQLMAFENHRNFALRRPKCLRRSSDFLSPTAPFMDEWGSLIGKHPGLTIEEKGEIAEALIEGWEWLEKAAKENHAPVPVGYGRALAGMIESTPGGEGALAKELPARHVRAMRTGGLRTICSQSKARFEESLGATALKLCRNK